MSVWNICGIILCALAAVLVLRETRKEWIPWIVISISLIVLCYCTSLLKEVLVFIKQFEESLPVVSQYTDVLIKGLGIATLTYTAGEICKAAGENGLAGYIEMTGKMELFLLGLPLFQDIFSIAMELLK